MEQHRRSQPPKTNLPLPTPVSLPDRLLSGTAADNRPAGRPPWPFIRLPGSSWVLPAVYAKGNLSSHYRAVLIARGGGQIRAKIIRFVTFVDNPLRPVENHTQSIAVRGFVFRCGRFPLSPGIVGIIWLTASFGPVLNGSAVGRWIVARPLPVNGGDNPTAGPALTGGWLPLLADRAIFSP